MSFFIALCITYLITPLAIRIAHHYDCIDIPSERKFHNVATPRWGGLAFFVGFLSVLFFVNIDTQFFSYLISSGILVIIGAIDDCRRLSWRIKLPATIIATSIVIFGGDILVHQIGTYGQAGGLDLGVMSIPFTFFAVIGVTNAINLIDGLNGLAGGVSLIAFLFMGIAAVLTGNSPVALACFVLVGALGGFLWYNFPKARIFMGDSGSLFLGFSLAIFAILLTQSEGSQVETLYPGLLLLIPIIDTVRVMFVRLYHGKNPFRADRTHLHHLMIRRGFSSVKTVIIFWSTTLLLGILALLLMKETSMPYAVMILAGTVVLTYSAQSAYQQKSD